MSALRKQPDVAEVAAFVATEAAALRAEYDAQLLPALLELEGVDRAYVEAQIVPLLARPMQVLVLKGGEPSTDAGNAAVKKALVSALGALDYDEGSIGFVRVGADAAESDGARRRLAERVVELADPEAVVAIDEAAWSLLGNSADEPQASVHGRSLIYVGDFEAALSSPKEKQRSWALLKTIKRETTIY